MAKRKRRKHTAEFKADAARLCRNGGKSIAQVASDLDIADSLLRQYFPKGTELSHFSQADLNLVARRLNGRPRKTLAFSTPADNFSASIAMTG